MVSVVIAQLASKMFKITITDLARIMYNVEMFNNSGEYHI